MSRRVVAALALTIVSIHPVLALGAGNDDRVEWNGVYSDPVWRQPRYPGKGSSFAVELRVFRGDITGARVRVWDGAERFHVMSWARNEGDFDIWRGLVAGTASDYLYYYFEITDGNDRDYFNALGMSGDPPSRGDFFVSTTQWGQFPLGATTLDAGVVFRVWAPSASAASVAGTFNDWDRAAHSMSRNRGFWEGWVPGARAGDEYRYVFDGGEIWRTDPRSRQQISSIGNSVVVDPSAYLWGDDGWVTPYFEDMIVYELHVGSFSGEGDGAPQHPGRYRDAVDRHLEHLVELGINVVELMPLGEFAGDISWGYNPTFLLAPESAYGSATDLKYLVDRCHQSGIAVILDVVFNHMGPGDLAENLLEYDGSELYFYPEGSPYRETPWGPRLDYGVLEARRLIRDAIRYWLEEYHLDGFRLDGTDFIKINGDGWEVLKDIVRTVDTVSRKAIVIAEQLPNDPTVTRPIEDGGAGCDSQWNDALHDNLRQAIRDAAFGDPNMAGVAAGINHFDLGDGPRAVNYIESHDEAHVHGRVAVEADGSDPAGPYARGRAKVAAAIVLFSAGIPMLLQGQEFLESRSFGDGRDERIDWRKKTTNREFFLFMRDAIAWRRTQPALRSSGSQNVYHLNDSDNVLALHRWTGSGDDVIVVVSLANNAFESYDLGFPRSGVWQEVLNGDAAVYGGDNIGNAGSVRADGPPLHGMPTSASVVLPRMGVLVFAREPVDRDRHGFVRGDCDLDGHVRTADALRLLRLLFLEAEFVDCLAACDGNGDEALDVVDPLFLLWHVFLAGPAPPSPWPICAPRHGRLECALGRCF